MLVAICSLYGYLAGAVTFLYPLANKLFTVYAYWQQNCLLFMPLGAKVFVLITLPRVVDRGTPYALKQVFSLDLHYF